MRPGIPATVFLVIACGASATTMPTEPPTGGGPRAIATASDFVDRVRDIRMPAEVEGSKGVAGIVARVKVLHESPSADVRAFGAELAAVLAGHQVELPVELRGPSLAGEAATGPAISEQQRLTELAHCEVVTRSLTRLWMEQGVRVKDAPPLPAGVERALLACMTLRAPTCMARLEAAGLLARAAMGPELTGQSTTEVGDPVAPELALRHWNAAEGRCFDTSAGTMSVDQIGALAYFALAGGETEVRLLSRQAEVDGKDLPVETILASVAALEEKFAGLTKIPATPELQAIIERGKLITAYLRQHAPAYSEQVQAKREVRQIVRGMVAAINKNDWTELAGYMPPGMLAAQKMKLKDPLPAMWDPAAVEIRIVRFDPVGQRGADPTRGQVDVEMEAIDAMGGIRKLQMSFDFEKVEGHWRLAER